MAVVLVIESRELIGPDSRWPIRVATEFDDDLVFLVRGGPKDSGAKQVDLHEEGELPERLRQALDEELGPDGWTGDAAPDEAEEKKQEQQEDEQERVKVALWAVPETKLAETTWARLGTAGRDRLMLVAEASSFAGSNEWSNQLFDFLRRCLCPVILVAPGERRERGDLLAAVADGSNARAAVVLGAKLARRTGSRMVGLYVEPDIGPDSSQVGERILRRTLHSVLGDGADDVAARVEVAKDPATGILKAIEEPGIEAVLLGVSRLAVRTGRRGRVAWKVAKAVSGPTLIAVRRGTPLPNRLRRWVERHLERFVPQLDRDDRISLVDRIQSNARWNLDFMLLMGLATIIAALGLLDDSPAVIIGAMLIAPLMTPLLGLGLAISQSNQQLARVTLKAAALGFVTAYVLALIVGLLAPDFHQSTTEMAARDWPQLLDLFIAGAAGFAAAYASSRPGLLAALPGVAIAAALVPPIATSGLALAIGSYDLAIGAIMLFAANIVSIVLAAASSLWIVGIRSSGPGNKTTRITMGVLSVAAVAMSVGLAFAPPRLAPPRELDVSIARTLGDEARVRRTRLKWESGRWVVQVDVGGDEAPDLETRAELLELARQHLGEDAGVRLTFRHEFLLH
jgi:uncharacterized hydrophobic protein (TIGR00271 family)